MAIITFNSTDSVGVVVDKINEVSTRLGNVFSLQTNDSNVVDGLNALRAATENFDESAEMIKILRSGYSAVNTTFQILIPQSTLSYNDSSGVFTLDRMDSIEFYTNFYGSNSINLNPDLGRLEYDSTNKISGNRIVDNSISIQKLNTSVSFSIRDENGAALLTIHSPGL